MTTQPVSLTAALASFTEIYSPRIVTRVNDYDVRILPYPKPPPSPQGRTRHY